MKIRISNNSLRYRLTRSEVERFAHEGVITETVQIGDDELTYILERSTGHKLMVSFKNNTIKLSVPQSTADNWTNTERVGFDNKPDTGLYLLVEKDFKCLDNVEEDQSDNYENPLAKSP